MPKLKHIMTRKLQSNPTESRTITMMGLIDYNKMQQKNLCPAIVRNLPSHCPKSAQPLSHILFAHRKDDSFKTHHPEKIKKPQR
jgi:hypothetical protein